MTFYDDSKMKYPDELICFTVQHEITGQHLFGKHNENINPHYHKIVWNMTMSNMGQHIKSLMQQYKTHATYREAARSLEERLSGYKIYKHRLRTDIPENHDIIRQALKTESNPTIYNKVEQLRILSHKISEDMFEDLYKFETVEVTEYNILDNARNLLFNNYFTSAGVLKEIPWADYHHIAKRQQFLEVKGWKTVYAVEANLDHFKATIEMISGKKLVLETLVKLPVGIILLEDKQDANLFSLMNTEARLYNITKLVKRMMQHRICE